MNRLFNFSKKKRPLTQAKLKAPPDDKEGADVMVHVQRGNLVLLLTQHEEHRLDELDHSQAHRKPAIVDRIQPVLVLGDGQLRCAASDKAKLKSYLDVLQGEEGRGDGYILSVIHVLFILFYWYIATYITNKIATGDHLEDVVGRNDPAQVVRFPVLHVPARKPNSHTQTQISRLIDREGMTLF